MSRQEWSPYVDLVDFVIMEEPYLTYYKALVRNFFVVIVFNITFVISDIMENFTVFLNLQKQTAQISKMEFLAKIVNT